MAKLEQTLSGNFNQILNKIEQGIINTPSYLKTNLNKFRDRLGEKGLKRFKNASFAIIMCAVAGTSTVVLAADDPLSVVNNLSNFIFGLIRAVGMIILGFSIVFVISITIVRHPFS